jgi:hypothetical protein
VGRKRALVREPAMEVVDLHKAANSLRKLGSILSLKVSLGASDVIFIFFLLRLGEIVFQRTGESDHGCRWDSTCRSLVFMGTGCDGLDSDFPGHIPCKRWMSGTRIPNS